MFYVVILLIVVLKYLQYFNIAIISNITNKPVVSVIDFVINISFFITTKITITLKFIHKYEAFTSELMQNLEKCLDFQLYDVTKVKDYDKY